MLCTFKCNHRWAHPQYVRGDTAIIHHEQGLDVLIHKNTNGETKCDMFLVLLFLCVQQSSQKWVAASAGSLLGTIRSAAATFPSEAEPHPVEQHALHARDACAQTALPQVQYCVSAAHIAFTFTHIVILKTSATNWTCGVTAYLVSFAQVIQPWVSVWKGAWSHQRSKEASDRIRNNVTRDSSACGELWKPR